jgi:hypothetical protein
VSSSPLDTRSFPSGLKTTDQTLSVCPSRTATSRRCATSHKRTVLSLLPDANSFPSRLNATEFTSFVCPLRIATSWRWATSHKRMMSSLPAEASNFPSRLNATAFTESVWLSRIAVICCPSAQLHQSPSELTISINIPIVFFISFLSLNRVRHNHLLTKGYEWYLIHPGNEPSHRQQ